MAGKEAIAFVIDASPSMAAPYPSCSSSDPPSEIHPTSSPVSAAEPSQPSLTSSQDSALERGLLDSIEEEVQGAQDGCGTKAEEGGAPTRLSAAKEACMSMISDLILQSKTNECAVIVCKASETRHHLCAEEQVVDGTAPFPNIFELSEMARPTAELLRQVQNLRPSPGEDEGAGGDLCDGIVVASDALHRRTSGKKFRRRLVVFTDAQHEVRVDDEQILMVVEGLKKLDCTLTVIGLDFTNSAEFCRPATEEDVDMDDDGGGRDDGDGDADGDDDRDDDDNAEDSSSDATGLDAEQGSYDDAERLALVKSENEKLLISLAKLTGGSVVAASTLQQILDSTSGRRIPKSTRRKVEFNIAPGLTVPARYSLLLSKQNIKSLKREVVLLDGDGNVKKNGLGEEMTSAVISNTTHWDVDKPDTEVTLEKRTQAFKYGADLIPIGAFDLEGLKMRSPVSITILGYTKAATIPRSHIIGDPYAVTGGDSRRACTAISALAQAMHKKGMVALCKFVKTKDADPLLGALYPLIEDDAEGAAPPHRLYCVQLPFAKDVQMISMFSLDDAVGGKTEADVCDDLIDSLMLPERALCSERIPNPAVRSFNKTLMNRAIDPSAGIAITRVKGEADGTEEDPMLTPLEVLQRAKGAIEAFRSAFPLEKPDESTKGSRSKKKFWSYAY